MGNARSKLKGLRAGVYTLSENLPNFEQNLKKVPPRSPKPGVASSTHQLRVPETALVRTTPINQAKIKDLAPKLEPGEATAAIDPSLPQFENYITTQRVAEGGMGCIFRALEQKSVGVSTPSWVAIKTLPSHTASESANPKAFRKAFKSLKREYQIAKKLKHPNLVNIHHFSPQSTGPEKSVPPYLVMEWLAGRTLKEVLQQTDKHNKRLSQELCAGIVREVAKGLEAMHGAGIIHRDITPQNIMLTYDGRVKIIDFGISKRVGADPGLEPREHTEEITRSEVIKGKPCYISPEQIEKGQVSPQSDIFTLGIVFWELLTGRRLFHGESFLAIAHQILECDRFIKNPGSVSSRIHREWDALSMRCLAKSPKNRFASASEVIYAVEEQFTRINSPLCTPQGFSTSLRDLMETLFEEEMVQELKSAGKIHLLSARPPAASAAAADPTSAPMDQILLEAHPSFRAPNLAAIKRGEVLRNSNEQQWNKFRNKPQTSQIKGRARAEAIKTLFLVSVAVAGFAFLFLHGF